MKINCKNGVITMSINYRNVDNTYKELKKVIENNYSASYDIFIILENENEYNFMKLAMNIGLYYHYSSFMLDIICDALITYEKNNLMALYIPNEEVHDKVSYLTSELEKFATRHNMWSDLRGSSIYRMLSYAQWRYENTIEEDGD